MTKFTSGLLGITSAGGAVLGVFGKIKELKDEAAAEARQSAMSFGRLSELAIKKAPQGVEVDAERADGTPCRREGDL